MDYEGLKRIARSFLERVATAGGLESDPKTRDAKASEVLDQYQKLRERLELDFLWRAQLGATDTTNVTLYTDVEFDKRGQLVASEPKLHSFEAFVTITLAEIVASTSPVWVLLCPNLECEKRLFVLEKARKKGDRKYCGSQQCNRTRTNQRKKTSRTPK